MHVAHRTARVAYEMYVQVCIDSVVRRCAMPDVSVSYQPNRFEYL